MLSREGLQIFNLEKLTTRKARFLNTLKRGFLAWCNYYATSHALSSRLASKSKEIIAQLSGDSDDVEMWDVAVRGC